MKVISLHDKVYDVIQQFPEARQIIVDLGFHHMQDDAMLNTAGRIMTLSKAARRHKLTYDDLNQAFEQNGFSLKEKEL